MTGRVNNPIAEKTTIVDNGCKWSRAFYVSDMGKLTEQNSKAIVAKIVAAYNAKSQSARSILISAIKETNQDWLTDDLTSDVLAHNITGQRLCGWGANHK